MLTLRPYQPAAIAALAKSRRGVDSDNFTRRKFCVWDEGKRAYGFIHGLHQSYPRFWIEGAKCKTATQVCEWMHLLAQQVWFSGDHCQAFIEITKQRGAWKSGSIL